MADAIPTTTAPKVQARPHWTWREGSAIAAAFVVGVLTGPYVPQTPHPLPFVSDRGRLVATGTLDAALSTLHTGEKPKDTLGTTIGMSFRTANGQYCRSFAMTRGPAGLACRERRDWVIEILARNPRPRDGRAPDGYRQAGTPFPDAIRQAVALRKAGEPLTTEEETQAGNARWRPERVLKDAPP